MVRDEQRAVERGGFSSNELRAQVGQIADISSFQTRSASSWASPRLRCALATRFCRSAVALPEGEGGVDDRFARGTISSGIRGAS